MAAANGSSAHRALGRFLPAVRDWFLETFDAPTPVQEAAWAAVEGGENALAIAPTGSGKTLAAFLFAIDALMREKAGGASRRAGASEARPSKGVRVLYVSPLKALGADVERNLQAPLAGIAERLAARGEGSPQVRTGMRTGDTAPDARRALTRNPPDILITTPESLYLMLTSKARETLRTVETVIVDEVHALAGDKRGAHLALSLERLDDLLERPAQRVGLSATVRPREEAARFLGGPHPVRVIAAGDRPDVDVRVSVPVRDMTAVPAFGGFGAPAAASARSGGRGGPRRAPAEEAWKSDRALRRAMAQDAPSASPSTPDSRLGSSSIWPYIEAAILDEVLAHRTTIVFVNSRGLCEKLTARLNELYASRNGGAGSPAGLGEGALDDASPRVSSPIRSDMGSTSELAQGAPDIIAKAHHGSVSKEKRLQVERELKRGELPCVVATSSLELGIDMGSIDLVLQVAAPPSVASGLQRIGRANHRVGGRPSGIVYPRTRTEVVDAAVAAEGMREGAIEATSMARNPLDVLSQQTVAAVSMDERTADEWYRTVRRAAPFSDLPRSTFDAVLDMLAGRYSSGDLSDFAPRIVWDRERGTLAPRPGAQRQAVTAAGTIPDRGMFSVVLPEGDGNEGRRRVGELDEEMVYESRVGDVIALGTSSWRIREITRDRVIVEPAPGRSARLPFWHGEGVGRPAEDARPRGRFLRAVVAGLEEGGCEADGAEGAGDALPKAGSALRERLAADGLDEDAQRNLVALVRAQREATGAVPDDRTLVVERCEDETGDWRVILHSPYGRRVHEPWAMAVSHRISLAMGFDAQVMAADDGIVVRIPMTETRLPGAELFAFDPDELERIVRGGIDATALFAARFRECAARALLMSPVAPGKRAPLWQQRLKAGQLLEAARAEPGFPILLEAARECLQDVYDMGSLRALMEDVRNGSVRFVEAQTAVPSPFAAPMLFGYVGEHLYQGDLPHAERQASLLSLDPKLLGELLGSADMGELLDADVVRTVEARLQRTDPDRRAHADAEGAADLLRALGPLSAEEAASRMDPIGKDAGDLPADAGPSGEGALDGEAPSATVQEARAAFDDLRRAKRAFAVTIGGTRRWASVEDAGRLRDALGAAVPAWVPKTFLEAPGPSEGRAPLDDLIARYARTHGPFSTAAAAARFGIGPSVALDALRRLAAAGKLVQGRFGCAAAVGAADNRPDACGGVLEDEWVSSEVLRRLRSLSLAKARSQVRAVPAEAYARFLLDRQDVGADGRGALEGIDGVAQVIAQFEGVFLPAASWEGQVLPARVRDYRPAMLDELLSSGDVVWVGGRREGEAAGPDGRAKAAAPAAASAGLVAFYPTDSPLAPVQADVSEDSSAFASPAGDGRVGSPSALHGPEAGSGPSAERALAGSRPTVESAVVDALGCGGGLFFRQIVDAVRRRLAPERIDSAAVGGALRALAWSGLVANDTFALVRAAEAADAAGRRHPALRRRASSRRGRRLVDADATRGAGVQPSRSEAFAGEGALSGRWWRLAPSQASGTVRAVATVESILDRYGVLARDVVLLSGVPGGMAPLFPVLRSMEDAGDVLRGVFVEGLGPAQFAARETVDLLRAYAAGEDAAEGAGKGGADPATQGGFPGGAGGLRDGFAVLSADDPASLFGAGMPWPPVAFGACGQSARPETLSQTARPTRRPGSLVVLLDGRPVLHATAGLRAVLAFASDERVLADAAAALVGHVARALRRAGGEGARRKVVVETFNGQPVLATPFADILQEAGLVRLPDGMRLYIDPFARA